ncbi:carboxylesterase family protein, partial [Kozakia baliensis]
MTLVTIDSGTIRGFADGPIETFLGIPYAAPIVPGTRFEAARPVAPWSGIREATQFGAICPQV